MTTQVTEILTPAARLVMGDCFEPQTKDAEGNPLVIKNGPNIGKPRVDYYLGVAIPKTDPGYNDIWAKIHGKARESFPSLFDASGNCLNPAFAFKVIDGDSQQPNSKGKKPCDREGFPGHWILNFSGGFAPKCYNRDGTGNLVQVVDPNMIKRGYYVRVYGSVKGNGSAQQPGVFLNHSMVELVGYGEEIFTGPSGDQVFGGTPVALPVGASATPLASATPAPVGMAPAPVVAPAPVAVAPAPVAPAVPTPAAVAPAPAVPGAIAPAPEFLDPGEQKVNANGTVYTINQLKTAGWSDEQIAPLPRV